MRGDARRGHGIWRLCNCDFFRKYTYMSYVSQCTRGERRSLNRANITNYTYLWRRPSSRAHMLSHADTHRPENGNTLWWTSDTRLAQAQAHSRSHRALRGYQCLSGRGWRIWVRAYVLHCAVGRRQAIVVNGGRLFIQDARYWCIHALARSMADLGVLQTCAYVDRAERNCIDTNVQNKL